MATWLFLRVLYPISKQNTSAESTVERRQVKKQLKHARSYLWRIVRLMSFKWTTRRKTAACLCPRPDQQKGVVSEVPLGNAENHESNVMTLLCPREIGVSNVHKRTRVVENNCIAIHFIGLLVELSEPKFTWIYSPSRNAQAWKIPETKVSKWFQTGLSILERS